MNKAGLIKAISVLITTVGAALVALFTTEGVTQFSDISQVAYAAVFIGGFVTATATYHAEISMPKKKIL